jgi:hypothetical protein
MTVASGSRHSMSYTSESTFGTTPTAILRNIATVAAASADNSYADAVEDLSVFKAGDMILVSGFTLAANNGLKHVVSATAAKIIVEETLADEALGDDVTIEIAFEELRNMGTTLALAKDTFQSEEIRSDRQITAFRHGNKRIEGDVSFEFSSGAFDELLEAALQGSWTSDVLKVGTTQRSFSVGRLLEDIGQMLLYDGVMVNTMSLSIPINAMVTGTFGLVGQSGASPTHVMFVLPGGTVEVGDVFTLSDKDGNVLVSYTAAAATVADVVSGLETAWNASTNAICAKYTALDVATTHLTLTADAAGTWYEVIPTTTNGGAADTQTMILTHSPIRPATAAAAYEPFDSFTGTIEEGASPIAIVTGIDLNLDNALTPAHVLMDDEVITLINGRSNVTGTLTCLVEDVSLVNKFVNETASSIEFQLEDPDGNTLTFLLPNLKYGAAEIPVADEGPVIVTLPFQALYDSTELTNLKITRA